MGLPTVDCFASRTMHHLPQYMSLSPDPYCQAVNAMYQPWEGIFPYLFPPFCLIGKTLQKLVSHRTEEAILVAPIWTTQPWFPQLLDQIISTPYILLKNADGEKHPLIKDGKMQLGAFLVTGNLTTAKAFQRELQTSSPVPDETVHQSLTLRPGENSVLGVTGTSLIHITQL